MLHDLPIEPAGVAIAVEVDVSGVGVAMDHAGTAICRLSHRFDEVVGVSEFGCDSDGAAVVQEGLEKFLGEELGHGADSRCQPLEVSGPRPAPC